jgi:stage II sporulation protein M
MKSRKRYMSAEIFGKNGRNLWLILFFIILGIAIGAFTVKMMSLTQKSELSIFLDRYFNIAYLDNLNKNEILTQSLINNYKMLGLIFLSSILVIGFPIIFAVLTYKGITIGFTVAFFMEKMKMKGLGIALSSILPQNIVFIPVLILASLIGLGFSFDILFRREGIHRKGYFQILSGYSIMFIILCGIFFIGCLIETYVGSSLMKIIIERG